MDKNWIKIFNRSFDELSSEELFIYAFLYRRRICINDNWFTETNIDLIGDTLNCKFDCKKREIKRFIKFCLLKLKNKNYIYCENLNEKTKNNDLLLITFLEDDHKGFNKNISYEMFDLFNDHKKFFIYCYIDRFGKQGVSTSINHWLEMLKISKNTFIKLINEMNSDNSQPRIYKFSGSYVKGKNKQEKNRYYTRPNKELIQQWNSWYNQENNFEQISNLHLCINGISYDAYIEDYPFVEEDFIFIDATNYQDVDFSRVKQILYWSNNELKNAPVERLACKKGEQVTKDMINYALRIYIDEFVAVNKKFTSKDGEIIQNRVKEYFQNKKQD